MTPEAAARQKIDEQLVACAWTISRPPLAEQTAIASILNHMNTDIAFLESKLSKACDIKQGGGVAGDLY